MPDNPNSFSNTRAIIAGTPEELGAVARAFRKEQGRTIGQVAAKATFGIRFLSEFERGKSTVEIGKVIDALHESELELAVVPKIRRRVRVDKLDAVEVSTMPLSQRLSLEFPYDWSNPLIDESTFIFLVLEKARFNDVLKVVHHFGFEQVEEQAKKLENSPQITVLNKYFTRIKKGIASVEKQASQIFISHV